MAITEETPLVASLDDTYQDDISEMTWGRRLARYLSKYQWYNPQVHNKDAPSLDEAWAYFEHVTLARHFKPVESAVDVNRKAEAGEDQGETQLYSVFTPESDLGDFGLGIGLYFYTLRALAIIMLIAGIINIPNLLFFRSDLYNGMNENLHVFSLKASAVCTDQTWQPCPTCTKQDWDHFPATYDRYAEATSNDGTLLTFIKTNNCNINNGVGVVSYVCLVYVCIAIYVLIQRAKKQEILFDEAALTTTDYAVEVSNPPLDARDPEEWKRFFEQFGRVASITVALDNEELVASLLKRRRLVMALRDLQPPGVEVDIQNLTAAVETALPLTRLQKLMFVSDAATLKKSIEAIDDFIANDLSKRTYGVSNVFVIFEREAVKQEALHKLSVGVVQVRFNMKSALPESLLFRGEHLLLLREPPEPSSVRWQDLDESINVQFRQRLVTYTLTLLAIMVSNLVVVRVRNNYGVAYGAVAVSTLNTIFPQICTSITNLESHSSEGSKQASIYVKITFARWIVTTMLTGFITPFTETLADFETALIPAMYSIFITELLKTPITKVLDIPGQVYRHVLAPRATDQRRMNGYFSGTTYQLSERYTEMTNFLFLTFYYAMIYPAGFFWASATLATNYWADKFCLLRNWAPAPMLGTEMARLSRLYFFSGALVAYALMSSYNFASFPYDNACPLDVSPLNDYVGTFSAITGAGNVVRVKISDGATVYKYCNQDMLRYKPWPAFPAIPSSQPAGSEWMDHGREFASIFGWTSVAVILGVLVLYLKSIGQALKLLLFGGFVSRDKPCPQDFWEAGEIYGYVPQSKLPGYLFPTLLCDVSSIDEYLIDWEDHNDPSKRSHNAIYDIPGLTEKGLNDGVFSTVKEWRGKKM